VDACRRGAGGDGARRQAARWGYILRKAKISGEVAKLFGNIWQNRL
jgi:hypothetical protein